MKWLISSISTLYKRYFLFARKGNSLSMKWLISYFSQIRHFTPNMLPLNTTVYPPTFFTECGIHLDKHGVILGQSCFDVIPKVSGCPCKSKMPPNCPFLTNYYTQLQSIARERFKYLYEIHLPKAAKQRFNINIDTLVLIVYEKYDNPCSERVILQRWFREHGTELAEFVPTKRTTSTIVSSLI